jgi:hypothetical protein
MSGRMACWARWILVHFYFVESYLNTSIPTKSFAVAFYMCKGELEKSLQRTEKNIFHEKGFGNHSAYQNTIRI